MSVSTVSVSCGHRASLPSACHYLSGCTLPPVGSVRLTAYAPKSMADTYTEVPYCREHLPLVQLAYGPGKARVVAALMRFFLATLTPPETTVVNGELHP